MKTKLLNREPERPLGDDASVEQAHTPGPWIAKKGSGWYVTRPDACHRRGEAESLESAITVGMTPATTLVQSPWFDDTENEANARLIAAAPDLLEALRGLLADITEYQAINKLGGENNHWQVRARAAIAKALCR